MKMTSALVALIVLAVMPHPAAARAACASTAQAQGSGYVASTDCGPSEGTPTGTSSPQPAPEPYEAYRWERTCENPFDSPTLGECSFATCPEGQAPFSLLGLKDGVWTTLGSECRGAESTAALTPADISRAFERIPVPRLRTIAQPGTKTLVNLDTIFHVRAEPFDRQITLLGQQVELTITPATFHWTWGDGTTTTTHTPGAPYPSRAVSHRYLHANTTVHASVTVTWTARWRTNNGTWADVPGTVQTTGPAATLHVVEAVPHLAGSG